MMFQDEIGMDTENIKKIIRQMEEEIVEEKNIEASLKEIVDELKENYKSENSVKLNSLNEDIIASQHNKRKNLESYKQYLEKYLQKYASNSIEAEQKAKHLNESNNKVGDKK